MFSHAVDIFIELCNKPLIYILVNVIFLALTFHFDLQPVTVRSPRILHFPLLASGWLACELCMWCQKKWGGLDYSGWALLQEMFSSGRSLQKSSCLVFYNHWTIHNSSAISIVNRINQDTIGAKAYHPAIMLYPYYYKYLALTILNQSFIKIFFFFSFNSTHIFFWM